MIQLLIMVMQVLNIQGSLGIGFLKVRILSISRYMVHFHSPIYKFVRRKPLIMFNFFCYFEQLFFGMQSVTLVRNCISSIKLC